MPSSCSLAFSLALSICRSIPPLPPCPLLSHLTLATADTSSLSAALSLSLTHPVFMPLYPSNPHTYTHALTFSTIWDGRAQTDTQVQQHEPSQAHVSGWPPQFGVGAVQQKEPGHRNARDEKAAACHLPREDDACVERGKESGMLTVANVHSTHITPSVPAFNQRAPL